GGEGDGIDVGADAVEVVLGEPEHVHAERIAQLRFLQRLLDDALIVRRVHRGRKQKIAEAHEVPYPSRSSGAAARNRSLPCTLRAATRAGMRRKLISSASVKGPEMASIRCRVYRARPAPIHQTPGDISCRTIRPGRGATVGAECRVETRAGPV